MNDKIENLKKTFLYLYSGEFLNKSLTEFNKSKKVDHTNRILFLKRINELFRYLKTQSFKTQSFKKFNEEEEFISFFKGEKMRKLVEAATSLNPVRYGMGAEKVGVIDVDPEEDAKSWKRVGKQYGALAEYAYVPPMTSIDKVDRFPELKVKERKFYVKDMSTLDDWADIPDPKIYEMFIKGKQES